MTVLNETTEFFVNNDAMYLIVLMVAMVVECVAFYYLTRDVFKKAWLFTLFALIWIRFLNHLIRSCNISETEIGKNI